MAHMERLVLIHITSYYDKSDKCWERWFSSTSSALVLFLIKSAVFRLPGLRVLALNSSIVSDHVE